MLCYTLWPHLPSVSNDKEIEKKQQGFTQYSRDHSVSCHRKASLWLSMWRLPNYFFLLPLPPWNFLEDGIVENGGRVWILEFLPPLLAVWTPFPTPWTTSGELLWGFFLFAPSMPVWVWATFESRVGDSKVGGTKCCFQFCFFPPKGPLTFNFRSP